MKKILYLFITLFALASCEHEMDNFPETKANTAIPTIQIVKGEKTYVDVNDLSKASVTYTIGTRGEAEVKSMDVKMVYTKAGVKDTTTFAVLTSFPSTVVLNKTLFGKNADGSDRVIEAGDNFYIYASKWTLADGTEYTPNSTYVLNTKDEDGKDEVLEVDNVYNDLEKAFYKYDNTIYVAGTPNGVIAGEYTVTLDGDKVLEDKTVTWTVDGLHLTCSHLIGDYIGIVFGAGNRQYVSSKLLDLGTGAGLKFISTSASLFSNPAVAIDIKSITVDAKTKVITVIFDSKYHTGVKVVFTPKK